MLRQYRRIWLTILLLGIAAIPMVVFLITNSVRNAPLEIGSGVETREATAIASDDGSVPYAPPPRDLLVTTDRDGSADIMLLESDGTLLNLTNDDSGAVDILGSWSMNGQVINFLSNRLNSDDFTPTQVLPDGSNLRTLTVVQAVLTMFGERLFDWDPRWSPDGASILWVSLRDLNLELYRIPVDAEFLIQNATRLTDGGARDWFPAWSPDGSKIAFSSNEAGDENIYVMDLATDTITQLTDDPENDTRAMWTRDGQQILFVSERDVKWSTGDLRIYVMDADGSNQRLLPDDLILEAGFVWSPDHTHVAYVSNRGGSWQVYVSNSDGSGVVRVTTPGANYMLPVWRP